MAAKVPAVPTLYDPPQLKPGYLALPLFQLTAHRQCEPCDPLSCWLAPLTKSCYLGPCRGIRPGRISEPDEWFAQMLKTGDHPKCPDRFKGIWWMQDNPVSEVLLTLHDADWVTDKFFVKYSTQNWSTDASNCWGSTLPVWWSFNKGEHRFEIMPDGKWIDINGERLHWMYMLQPEDTLTRPDGSAVEFTPGEDMMRVSYSADGTMFYQYLVRRVAHLGDRGNLVKTPWYDELKRRALAPSRRSCLGRKGGAVFEPDEILICDQQQVVYAPAPMN